MAPPIVGGNQRGSALVEAAPVFLVLAVFTMGLLTAGYLLFARAWIQWRSEQALYCIAIEQSDGLCRRQLEDSVRRFLPWGEARFSLSGSEGRWFVTGRWHWGEFQYLVNRSFDARAAASRRDLRW